MKTVYFVRHGQSQANIEKVFAGSGYDAPLTQTGLEQARNIGTKLRGKPIDIIVSSPLKRAKETADCIAKEIGYKGEIRLQPLLKERDYGVATGQPWGKDIEVRINDDSIDGLEKLEQLATRMQQLLDWLKTLGNEHILVVGHGTAESMLYTIYQGKSYKIYLQTEELQNAMIREYRLND